MTIAFTQCLNKRNTLKAYEKQNKSLKISQEATDGLFHAMEHNLMNWTHMHHLYIYADPPGR